MRRYYYLTVVVILLLCAGRVLADEIPLKEFPFPETQNCFDGGGIPFRLDGQFFCLYGEFI